MGLSAVGEVLAHLSGARTARVAHVCVCGAEIKKGDRYTVQVTTAPTPQGRKQRYATACYCGVCKAVTPKPVRWQGEVRDR